jgi:hypothetical protein
MSVLPKLRTNMTLLADSLDQNKTKQKNQTSKQKQILFLWLLLWAKKQEFHH